jgi:monofunctional biosynthetic peptidoglycan transglycosylase
MARKKSQAADLVEVTPPPLWRWAFGWLCKGLAAVFGLWLFLILLYSFVPPLRNPYQWQETLRLGAIDRDWVPFDQIAPEMARSVVAAEDANFCLHWGFDLAQIRAAIADGQKRGASTISQQVVKNVFLWQGRSYIRKALEAILTPVVELMWSKQRILEVYLNEAEFGEGVFGVGAAARVMFDSDAASLTPKQAARLAAVLPNPKEYSADKPGPFVRKRAGQIMSGAETIAADGRAACFETLD